MTTEQNSWRDKISEILVKHSMPTRQVAINEIVELLHSHQDSIRKKIGEMKKEGYCQHDQDGACYSGEHDYELCLPSYNQAISDILALLQAKKKELSKLSK